jgi:trans-aconitate methyltransferase
MFEEPGLRARFFHLLSLVFFSVDCQTRAMALRDLTRGRTFDAAATSYDLFRPRYPRELFDDVADVAGVGADSRILEVGCGPGIATEEMMARGWSVLGVDPGAQLAKVARDKFGDERFAVEISTFDEWDPCGRHFDVVFSAAAYHWVAPALRWVKAADVLVDGGYIALAGNKWIADDSFHDFSEATRELRVTHGVDDERETPALEDLLEIVDATGYDIGALWEAMSPQGTDVIAGGLFGVPDVRFYQWTTTYSTVEAMGLLATYSRFLVMDPSQRSTLFTSLAAIIDGHYGGQLTRHYVTVLAMAPRSPR